VDSLVVCNAIMITVLEAVEHLPRLTPGDLRDRRKRNKTPGNKEAFLRAACGTMSKAQATRLQKLIDENCERIDE
jgi:hypothetical protein